MTKEEAEHVVQATFGPRAELCRVSSRDRDGRFVIALGSYRLSRTERPVPLLLGAGDSWASAIAHARTTDNGKMALKEQQKVKDLVNKAMESKSPGDFTEAVREMSILEAKEKGFSKEAIDKLNQKFDEAKKKVIEKNDNDSGSAKAAEAGREGQGSGDDHRGTNGEGEQER